MKRNFSLAGPTDWSAKTLMWLLVCLVAIATLDDFWSIAMPSSGSQLLIAADDDPDDSALRMPVCALGSVGHRNLRSFARKPINVHETVAVRSSSWLQREPRGPPKQRSDDLELPPALSFEISTADTALVTRLSQNRAAKPVPSPTIEAEPKFNSLLNRPINAGVAAGRDWIRKTRTSGQ